jgi:hypothetical protein
MASLLKRTIFLFAGFLVLQMASGAFAQGRMGMMMARQQMAMNPGMMGQFNPNLVPSLTPGLGTNWNWMSNIYGNRGYGYPGSGGGYRAIPAIPHRTILVETAPPRIPTAASVPTWTSLRRSLPRRNGSGFTRLS